jgi:GNAT superfamily N-acetyltransferase
MIEIRLLEAPDIPAVMELNRAAGWNQTEADWLRLLELEPEGCFGLWCGGRIAATATAVCYGTRLAWIGMVLTHPDFRRRGFARVLTERAIAYAESRVEWIKLDATDMGRPLYLALGFEDEAPIERWRAVLPAAGDPGALEPFRLDGELDGEAFGADRSALLLNLARQEAACAPDGGYIMARPGAQALFIGPCVARSAGAARRLLAWVASRHAGEPAFWDLLPANSQALELANEFGFAPARKLVRMVRPGGRPAAPWRSNDRLVYACAGFEYG